MSLSLTELQAVTDDYWIKTPTDIYFFDSVMLYKLMGNGKMELDMVTAGELVDGGLMIRVPLEYAPSNTGTYGTSTVFSTTKATILNAARFPWAGYHADNLIDLNDQVQNAGREAMVDLAFSKIKNIQTTIRDNMGTNIFQTNGYTGAGADLGWVGLGNMFDTNGADLYGQIAQNDMPTWAANVITTSEAISFPVLQNIRRTASIGQSIAKKPDLYVTTEALRDGYESTLQIQARYKDEELLRVGFMNVKFGEAPVVADDKAAANTLYAMNTRFIKIKTHRDYPFTKHVWQMISPTQPDLMIANSRWVGQLVCNNRKAHCLHQNLSLPA